MAGPGRAEADLKRAMALEAEVDSYLASFADERDDNGHRLVVSNGHAKARSITTVAGAIEAPRMNDKGGGRHHRTAPPLQELDHPAVVPQEPQGRRGPSADEPA